MAPINVGIVGYGFAAKAFHLPFITANPDYNVAAILQRVAAPADPSTAPAGSHCTVDYPKAKHYRTADEFFADSGIELVVVATHGDTHALFAEKALTAGKHGERSTSNPDLSRLRLMQSQSSRISHSPRPQQRQTA